MLVKWRKRKKREIRNDSWSVYLISITLSGQCKQPVSKYMHIYTQHTKNIEKWHGHFCTDIGGKGYQFARDWRFLPTPCQAANDRWDLHSTTSLYKADPILHEMGRGERHQENNLSKLHKHTYTNSMERCATSNSNSYFKPYKVRKTQTSLFKVPLQAHIPASPMAVIAW